MIPNTETPESTLRSFTALFAQGDLDGLLAMYEADGAFVAEPGRTAHGREAIAAALRPMLALSPKMEGTFERVTTAGDIALVAFRWRMTGTAPDGAAVEMGGLSSDVLRRRADGTWGIQIDDPWGGVTSEG